MLQKCDPNSEAGKQIRARIKGELLADAFDHTDRDIPAEISSLQAMVDHPRYGAMKAEYDRSKPKHWYGMWGGPNNIERLAGTLRRLADYEVLYRYWSGHAHGESALKRLLDGKPEMDPVRSPKGLPGACRHACSLANEMAAFLRDRFVPHLREELGRRYLDRIKAGMDYINSVRGLEG